MAAASFEALGLPASAPFDAVRKQFLVLAAELHPDKGGKDASRFDEVKKAFEDIAAQERQDPNGRPHAPPVEKPSLKACGSAAFQRGEFGIACEFFRQALDEGEPGRSALWSNLSAALLADGKGEEALEAADECIETEPGWLKGYYRRGEALFALREYARAQEAFSTALEMAPGDALITKKLGELQLRMQAGGGARKGMAHSSDSSSTQPAWGRALATAPEPPPAAAAAAFTPVTTSANAAPNSIEAGVARSERTGGGQAPPLLRQGGSAFDAIRRKKEEKKAKQDQSQAAAAAAAAAAEQAAAAAKAAALYKRCKLCGNVVHRSMNTCTSCCLPLVELESFDAAELPRAGAKAAAEMLPPDSDDDDDGANAPATIEPAPVMGPALPPPGYLERAATGAAAEPAPAPTATPGQADGAAVAEEDRLEAYKRRLVGEAAARRECARGHHPSLEPHYAALGLPLGSGEGSIRRAYRELVYENHPDSGGTAAALRRVQAAYEALSYDALLHDEGVGAMAAELAGPGSAGGAAEGGPEPTIFVSVAAYRDAEAVHTLRDLFAKAAHPARVRVGVVWQYVSELPRPDAGGKVVTRLFTEVNLLTQQCEIECAKIKDVDEQYRYMKRVKKYQVQRQAEAHMEELRAHTRDAIPDEHQSQVREMHVPFHEAEGPCYARHLAMRLYGGESHVLQIDAHTRFTQDWDQKLLAMLTQARAQSDRPLLTTYPLAYTLEESPVVDMEGKLMGHLGKPGTAILPENVESTPPSVVCALKFGPTALCHMGARVLNEVPAAPVPSLFFAGMFAFGPAEALVLDAPPDPHAPYLNLGEEASMGCRLWTAGWDLYTPQHHVVFHLYKNNYRPLYMNEDRRMGQQLYAGEEEAYGSLDEFNQRNALKKLSCRRVSAVTGAEAAASGAWGSYGPGAVRDVQQWVEHTGLDHAKSKASHRALLGGQPADAFSLVARRFQHLLAPTSDALLSPLHTQLQTPTGGTDFPPA